MLKKKLGFLCGIMVLLSLAGYFICLFAGDSKQLNREDEFVVVTSFYPMYVLAENLTEGVDGITVSNLTENQTGCLHDYQLTAWDMKLLATADAFVINGAGMELFMDKVLDSYAELPVIEASYNIPLLEGVAHDHDHGVETDLHGHEDSEVHEEEEFHAEHDEEEEHTGAHTHSHEENGHVWLDVERYRQQLVTVTEELQRLFPEQTDTLSAAADVYDDKLQELFLEIKELKGQTQGIPVVIFHEAFAYLAESLEMEVLMALSLDEETVPSAGEIAEVIEEINYHGAALILIEEAYAEYAEKILEETAAEVVYLDPLVTGDGAADSYLVGMRKNLETIRKAAELR